MRILIAVHGFPPMHSAGAERQAERMARWLVEAGHLVEVLAIEDVNAAAYHLESHAQDGITVHRVSYNVHGGDHPFLNSYDNPLIDRAMMHVLDRQQFDLVHIISGYLVGTPGIEAATRRGIPVAVSPMEFYFLCIQLTLMQSNGSLCSGPESDAKCARCRLEEKRSVHIMAQKTGPILDTAWGLIRHTPLVRRIEQDLARRREHLMAALNQASLVICNSQFLIDKFGEFGFDTSRYIKIRQGLATDISTKARHIPRPGDGTLRLGYTGQIKPHKGVDLLVTAVIESLRAGVKVSLDLWGNESEAQDYVSKLKSQAAPYPGIRFNGRYLGSQVWDVLSRLDSLVVPSRWYENSPNVILEAFEMGLPVVATRLGGMAELVQHDHNGLLFAPDDATDLQKMLYRLIDEAGLLERLKAGIPAVKTIDAEMREVMGAYERMLTRQRQN
jgi:glycosyltransferase involved in cell wall biosynthesis